MTRPPSILIDDLAAPQFSSGVKELLDGMGAMGRGIVLSADEMLAQARAATGLDDYGGDPAFFDRVRVYVDALRDEAQLTSAGTMIVHSQTMQMLTNRLLATDYINRHPGVRDEPIVAPIVIVGLPRTGTTHLHNLMATDANLRSLPYWESLEPVPPIAEQRGELPDQRRDRCEGGVWFLNETMPHFKRMHEMTVDHVHEEIQLLAVDCSTMLLETTAHVPSWRDYYKMHDQQTSYNYLKLLLQMCQHQRPAATPQRWVLKSPQHLEQIPVIMHTFPDATVVFTHRDPVSVIVSFVTMVAYAARLSRTTPIDLVEIGEYWRDRILDLFSAATRDRGLAPSDQSFDVHFNAFMADDIAMVRRVYDVAQQPFTTSTREAMDAFMADHPRGRFGAVEYELAQFGLDASQIRDAASEYIEMFQVNLEDRW